jgi:hypothetical protein
MVRSPAAADESLAAILARIKLGIAIAAMIRINSHYDERLNQ